MNDIFDFYRNVTFFDEYDENSFIGRWLDYSEWNDDEYFKLEISLIKISQAYKLYGYIEQDILMGIMRVVDLLMISDWSFFEVKDLDIYVRYDRLKYVLSKIFSKEEIILNEFEYNPIRKI